MIDLSGLNYGLCLKLDQAALVSGILLRLDLSELFSGLRMKLDLEEMDCGLRLRLDLAALVSELDETSIPACYRGLFDFSIDTRGFHVNDFGASRHGHEVEQDSKEEYTD